MMRFGRRYPRLIAPVIIFFFVWLSVRPWNFASAASKTPRQGALAVQHEASVRKAPPAKASHEAELAATLKQVETALITLQTRLDKSEDASHAVAALTRLRQRLEQLDTQVQQNFIRLEQHLKDKKLPETILQRHRTMVAAYKGKLTTLLGNLVAIESANSSRERQLKTVQALEYLQAAQPQRPKPSFDPNNLPFRVPDGKIRKPRETKQEFHTALNAPQPTMVASAVLLPGLIASAAAAEPSLLPTPDDLSPTEDVQFTEDIQALAASLNHDPITIYKWVHDNIEFLPTYGSIQGAQMTLETKRGNAFDIASLLIALLRTSNIPARYVQGTVQIPITQVMNWVGGVTVPEAALQVLGQGGIPNTGLVQNDAIVAVKLEHVWVEAWVDYVPSRGVANIEGDTWVPMDGAFKQYTFTEGMDIPSNVPFDAQGLIDQLITTAQINETTGSLSGIDHALIQTTLTGYQAQVDAFIEAQESDATVGDVLGTKTIIAAPWTVLPASLSYRVVIHGNEFAEIPETLRHKYQFTLYASTLDRDFDTPVLRLTENLPALAGKKITLFFTPASEADAELLASFLPEAPGDGSPLDPSPITLPGYLIRLVPELRVEGQVVASGGPFVMGQELVSVEGMYNPIKGWTFADANTPVVGEYRAIAIDVAGISGNQVQDLHERLTANKERLEIQSLDLTQEDLLGDLLYTAVLGYFVMNDILSGLNAPASDVVSYRLPSFGSFTAVVESQRLFGIPRTVSLLGLEMDIDRNSNLAVSKAGTPAVQVAYVQQIGVWQSALEHIVPERIFSTTDSTRQAVSAVKALMTASSEGQQIYTITSDNVASVLPLIGIDPDVKTAIQNAVAAGKQAIVSQQPVTVHGWTGVGYILMDPATGSGAYLISGGANGSLLLLNGIALLAIAVVLFSGGAALAVPVLAAGGLIPEAAGLMIGGATFLTFFGLPLTSAGIAAGAKWSEVAGEICDILTVVFTMGPLILASVLTLVVGFAIAILGIGTAFSIC